MESLILKGRIGKAQETNIMGVNWGVEVEQESQQKRSMFGCTSLSQMT